MKRDLSGSLVQITGAEANQTRTPYIMIKEDCYKRFFVVGTIDGRVVAVLIDSGTTSNFISAELVERFELPTDKSIHSGLC